MIKSAKDVDSYLALNTIFLDEIPALLSSGHQPVLLRKDDVIHNEQFYLALNSSNRNRRYIPINKRAERVEALQFAPLDIFRLLALHSNLDEFHLPLTKPGIKSVLGHAEVLFARASPIPRFTIKVWLPGSAEPLKHSGERRDDLLFGTLGGALVECRKKGACRATVKISENARLYFKSRAMRIRLFEEAVKNQGMSLRAWLAKERIDYQTYRRAIDRGDDIPEIRKKIATVAGKSIEDLWVPINWKDE